MLLCQQLQEMVALAGQFPSFAAFDHQSPTGVLAIFRFIDGEKLEARFRRILEAFSTISQ